MSPSKPPPERHRFRRRGWIAGLVTEQFEVIFIARGARQWCSEQRADEARQNNRGVYEHGAQFLTRPTSRFFRLIFTLILCFPVWLKI